MILKLHKAQTIVSRRLAPFSMPGLDQKQKVAASSHHDPNPQIAGSSVIVHLSALHRGFPHKNAFPSSRCFGRPGLDVSVSFRAGSGSR